MTQIIPNTKTTPLIMILVALSLSFLDLKGFIKSSKTIADIEFKLVDSELNIKYAL